MFPSQIAKVTETPFKKNFMSSNSFLYGWHQVVGIPTIYVSYRLNYWHILISKVTSSFTRYFTDLIKVMRRRLKLYVLTYYLII